MASLLRMKMNTMFAVLSLICMAHVSARHNLPNPSNNNTKQSAVSNQTCGSSPCSPPPPLLNTEFVVSEHTNMKQSAVSSPPCGSSPCAPPPPPSDNNTLKNMKKEDVSSPTCGHSPCAPPPSRVHKKFALAENNVEQSVSSPTCDDSPCAPPPPLLNKKYGVAFPVAISA
ncbi:pectinesterase inhibitor 10-like [Cryptomeria japonica]|uniref:pectinesterase inhibitor 10-like n=1 Tax=Cryptomeria japonica TaxID=3369 RepID=UPI0027D9E86F|nr:pectinesterase inhibitor 10-like [Cryptomeria japonica]